LQVFMVTQAMS